MHRRRITKIDGGTVVGLGGKAFTPLTPLSCITEISAAVRFVKRRQRSRDHRPRGAQRVEAAARPQLVPGPVRRV